MAGCKDTEMCKHRCWDCNHSEAWTLDEHKRGVKKMCYLKWEEVPPDGLCEHWRTWLARNLGEIPGVLPATAR